MAITWYKQSSPHVRAILITSNAILKRCLKVCPSAKLNQWVIENPTGTYQSLPDNVFQACYQVIP